MGGRMQSREGLPVHGRTYLIIAAMVSLIVLTGVAIIGGSEDASADSEITWKVEGSTLTVEGAGDIPDYMSFYGAPWSIRSSSVDTLVVGEGITGLGEYSFAGFPLLKEVTLPSTLKSIGDRAFRNCVALERIEIPASVTEISPFAFERCFYLETISVAEGSATYSSNDGVLFSADGKTLVLYPEERVVMDYSIPEGTETIASWAFTDTTFILSVTAPSTLRTISASAFVRCNALSTLTLNPGLESIGS